MDYKRITKELIQELKLIRAEKATIHSRLMKTKEEMCQTCGLWLSHQWDGKVVGGQLTVYPENGEVEWTIKE